MKKVLLVMQHEYIQQVLNKRFLLNLIIGPILLVLIIPACLLVTLLLALAFSRHHTVGYVDYAGILGDPSQPLTGYIPSDRIELVPFEAPAQAEAALRAKQIEAYYVLDADYRQTRRAQLVSLKNVNFMIEDQFEDFVRASLLSGLPTDIASRILEGDDVIVHSLEGEEEEGFSAASFFKGIGAFVAIFFFLFTLMLTSSYLIKAIAEEKENRTMEILVTSISVPKLVLGKVTGLVSASLTPMFLWTNPVFIIIVGAILVSLLFWINPSIARDAPVQPSTIINLILLLIALVPAYISICALMVGMGSLAADENDAQSASMLLFFIAVIPLFFIPLITDNPNGSLAVGLSFFPLTAPVALILRTASEPAPIWLMELNILVLVLASLAALWLSVRLFRLGMLEYESTLTLRQVFTAARHGVSGFFTSRRKR